MRPPCDIPAPAMIIFGFSACLIDSDARWSATTESDGNDDLCPLERKRWYEKNSLVRGGLSNGVKKRRNAVFEFPVQAVSVHALGDEIVDVGRDIPVRNECCRHATQIAGKQYFFSQSFDEDARGAHDVAGVHKRRSDSFDGNRAVIRNVRKPRKRVRNVGWTIRRLVPAPFCLPGDERN